MFIFGVSSRETLLVRRHSFPGMRPRLRQKTTSKFLMVIAVKERQRSNCTTKSQ